MRKTTAAGLVTATAAAALIGLNVSPASAAGTFTVSPGGTATGTATNSKLTDLTTGTVLTCTKVTATVVLPSGSGHAGAGLGSITATSFTGCTGPLGLSFGVTPVGLPWSLNADSYSGGVTTGSISGVKAHLSGTGCSADVTGPGGGTGTVPGTYTNSSGVLAVAGGNLTPASVSGCFGLIANGDATSFTANFAVSPAQTITSP